MKIKSFALAVSILAVLALAVGSVARAQSPLPDHLAGTISDYTPLISTASPTGPWEMRGHWSLRIDRKSGKAEFAAYMTMELSDYWILSTNSNPANPAIRSAHTHHILMTDATVSTDPAETGTCPSYSPANTVRFVVNGTANFVSGNGNPAPFEKNGPSMLQVCISGGTDGESEVQFSNMSLVFTGPASTHFGTQAIHGAVRFPHKPDEHDPNAR